MATCKPGYGRQFDSADESLRPKQFEYGRTLDASVVNIDHPYDLVEEDFASASFKASARRQVIGRQPATLLRHLISARGAQTGPKVSERVGAPFRHTDFHFHKRVSRIRRNRQTQPTRKIIVQA